MYDTAHTWRGKKGKNLGCDYANFLDCIFLEVISPAGASNGQILFLIPISKSSWLDLTVWIFQLMLT